MRNGPVGTGMGPDLLCKFRSTSETRNLLAEGMTCRKHSCSQPYWPGGFWQQGRQNQLSSFKFALAVSGQSSATTATFGAGLNTAAGTITSGKTLLTYPALTCTSFSSATVMGRLLISNWGSGYGTSSVATDLQTSGNFTWTNSTAGGAFAAVPTQMATAKRWICMPASYITGI